MVYIADTQTCYCAWECLVRGFEFPNSEDAKIYPLFAPIEASEMSVNQSTEHSKCVSGRIESSIPFSNPYTPILYNAPQACPDFVRR